MNLTFAGIFAGLLCGAAVQYRRNRIAAQKV